MKVFPPLDGTSIRSPNGSTPEAPSLRTGLVAQREDQPAIDIQNSIKARQSAGSRRRATIENLKRAAATMNFLTEHDIGSYEELAERCNAVAAASISLVSPPAGSSGFQCSIKLISALLKDMIFSENGQKKSRKPGKVSCLVLPPEISWYLVANIELRIITFGSVFF